MIVWITGLPASGKTTTALALCQALRDRGYDVQLLDGDAIRSALSPDLGWTKAERDMHIGRMGWLALMLETHGVIAVVAAVSPYRAARDDIRVQAERFVEVYVDTPLATCMQRDSKGTYRRQQVTGVSDPYEPPLHPEVHLHPDVQSTEECVQDIVGRMGLEPQGPYSLFIGRWQPFHEGHRALIQSVLDEGKPVCIAIRDTPLSEHDPYTVAERVAMLRAEFPQVRVIVVPDIAEVCYGREVGWGIREIRLPEAVEAISGTAIRARTKDARQER